MNALKIDLVVLLLDSVPTMVYVSPQTFMAHVLENVKTDIVEKSKTKTNSHPRDVITYWMSVSLRVIPYKISEEKNRL